MTALYIVVTTQMEKVCDDSSTSDGDSKAWQVGDKFNTAYETADKFFCTVACPCEVTAAEKTRLETTKTGPTWSYVTNGSGNKACQYCANIIDEIYDATSMDALIGKVVAEGEYTAEEQAKYKADNPDKANRPADKRRAKFQEVMNYLGEIEEDNKCSGFCNKQIQYYFSDVGNGQPEKPCLDALKGPIALELLGKYAICFMVIAFALMAGWCCHCGLWKGNKKKKPSHAQVQNTSGQYW